MALEIAEGIFHLGQKKSLQKLPCNPYLLVDADEVILFDPGSRVYYEDVKEAINEITSLNKITHIVLHHQDPDLCASVPLLEEDGVRAKIVTHWRTFVLAVHYGIKSPLYAVNENSFTLTLKSGRVLSFLFTPFLHFASAIITFDTKTKTAFTSDIFGAFMEENVAWADEYGEERYIEAMKAFHEHYMPGHEFLDPVMKRLAVLSPKFLAPQHGAVIRKNISRHIEELAELRCGLDASEKTENLKEAGGYKAICNQVLTRYYALYSGEKVKKIFDESDVILNENGLIEDFRLTGKNLWEMLFSRVLSIHGASWLSIIEPFLNTLIKRYGIDFPSVYTSVMFAYESKSGELLSANEELMLLNDRLESSLDDALVRMTKCPVTKLYNESFFLNYIEDEIINREDGHLNKAIISFSIDQILKINESMGEDAGTETIRNLAYILKENIVSPNVIFRLKGPSFVCILTDTSETEAYQKAESIRVTIQNSDIFVMPTTVSSAVIYSKDIEDSLLNDNPSRVILSKTLSILKFAKTLGGNRVLDSSKEVSKKSKGNILIAESDKITGDILKTELIAAGYNALVATDGIAAYEAISSKDFDVVISEVSLPKQDGFILREKVLASSTHKDTAFIYVSYTKNTQTIVRAHSLGVPYFLRKPINIVELKGIVSFLVLEERKI